jgi:hypothetical protein
MGEPELTAAQRLIADAVRRRASLLEDREGAQAAVALVRPSHRGMSPAQRLEVYREQFWLRHWPNLEDDFLTLQWALGGAAFRDLTTRYLCAEPPRTWDLQRLGAGLPEFVATTAPFREDALAVDAARLDWAFMEIFDAPDAPPLHPQALAGLSEEQWPRARLVLHPALRILRLSFAVHDLREAIRRGESPSRPAPHSSVVVVWRSPSCVLGARALDADEADLLTALRDGAPLGDACEALASSGKVTDVAEFGSKISRWFESWTAASWISRVEVDG